MTEADKIKVASTRYHWANAHARTPDERDQYKSNDKSDDEATLAKAFAKCNKDDDDEPAPPDWIKSIATSLEVEQAHAGLIIVKLRGVILQTNPTKRRVRLLLAGLMIGDFDVVNVVRDKP